MWVSIGKCMLHTHCKVQTPFFLKHIILSSSKHKHLWENWTHRTSHSNTSNLQSHKLVPNYNKQKHKPKALHYGKKVLWLVKQPFNLVAIHISTKTSPTNAKGILPSHHNNIDGKLLTIVQYNLHMGNFAKYRIVVQTCTQQVVGG
jgi:hypothetical protein